MRIKLVVAVVVGAVALWAAPSGADECGDCVDGGVVGVVEVEDDGPAWDEYWEPGIPVWGGGGSDLPQPAQPVDPGPGLGGGGGPVDDVNLVKEGRGIRQTREALAREGCRSYLSGPGGAADTVYQEALTGGRLRMDPMDKGEYARPDGSIGERAARTEGTGADAQISVYGPWYFDTKMERLLTEYGVDQPLDADEGRLLTLLHEVGHATGAYGEHSDADIAEINRQIYERCIR